VLPSLPKELLYSAYRFSAKHLAPNGGSKDIHGTCFHIAADDEVFVVTNKHNFSLPYADQKYVGYKIDSLLERDDFIANRFGIPKSVDF
jgi:hypothetical protein